MSPYSASTSAKAALGTVKVKAWSSVAVWSAIGLARVGASLVLATVSANTSLTASPASSVAVSLICSVPTSALRGVPLNSRSFASNFSHDGSALPSASVAVQVSLSPTSTSAKVEAGTLKSNSSSSVACWSAMALASVGASLVFSTVTLKVSVISSPALSVAVTSTSNELTSPLAGVPEKVRVAASNFSHSGRAPPLASCAE